MSGNAVTADTVAPALRFNVTLPVTRLGLGPFSFDPVEQMIGVSLKDILEPLQVGQVQRRPSASGPAVELFPLALPDGEGISIPLAQFGELGLRADGGLLVLIVPLPMAAWVRQRVGHAIKHESKDGLDAKCMARVAEFWLKLTPGTRARIPLGMFGEIGIEAA